MVKTLTQEQLEKIEKSGRDAALGLLDRIGMIRSLISEAGRSPVDTIKGPGVQIGAGISQDFEAILKILEDSTRDREAESVRMRVGHARDHVQQIGRVLDALTLEHRQLSKAVRIASEDSQSAPNSFLRMHDAMRIITLYDRVKRITD